MSTKKPSKPRPSGQGSAGSAHVQPPRSSGKPRDSGPRRTQELNTSITKPGKGTRGSGTAHRSVKRGN